MATITPSSNKKYEITITQPPEHEPRPDFIRGIPYVAKDNVMICKSRAMNLDDMKEMDPSATVVPENIFILQDINGYDLIITSDMIDSMAKMQLFICTVKSEVLVYSAIGLNGYIPKQNINGKSYAMLAYASGSKDKLFVKISDVDSWILENI